MIKSVVNLLERDLDRLVSELEKYKQESDLWKVSGDIANSGGNLTLHIVGNMNHFIGHILGNTDYKRDREAEFNDKHIPKTDMIKEVVKLKETIKTALHKYSESDLNEIYPIEVFGKPMTIEYFLIHLQGHLNYHLGQINYHRRLLT